MIDGARIQRLARRIRRRVERVVFELGDSVECNHCGWTGLRFLAAGAPNRQCPRCGSLERYRALRPLMERWRQERVLKLEVAPTQSFEEYCDSTTNVEHVGTDPKSAGAMVWTDLIQMGMKSSAFDLIVCMHVLEHIPDDLTAVPLVGPHRFGDPSAGLADHERLLGQRNHVPVYRMDIVDRTCSVGLEVRALDLRETLTQSQRRRHVLDGDDRYLFVVSKVTAQ